MRKLLTVLAVGSLMALGGLVMPDKAQAAAGCDDFAIMRCGASSPQDFVNKANQNAAGDLKNIYANYGLVPAEYARFASEAKRGVLYEDGRIVVDGKVVARSNQNLGRIKSGGFNQAVNINGKQYWGGSFGSTYHANQANVSVLFDDKGVVEFAVIDSCGNPQRITPTIPRYACNALNKQAVAGQPNTYTFSVNASATNGAEFVKAVIDYGDGNTRTINNLTHKVTHAFTKDATVKVTVYVKLPNGKQTTVTSADCMTQIKFVPPAQPYATCMRLQATLLNQASREYRFTADANFGNGVRFVGADFNFGDGVTMTDVRPNGTQAIINHTYARDGNYTASVTLKFTNPDGSSRTANCQAAINPSTPPEECIPGVPVGSPECEPGKLTETGAGTVALGVIGGIGTLAGAGHYIVRRRLGL